MPKNVFQSPGKTLMKNKQWFSYVLITYKTYNSFFFTVSVFYFSYISG